MSDEKVLVEMTRKDFDRVKHIVQIYTKNLEYSRNYYHKKHPEPKARIHTQRKTQINYPQMKLITV